MGIDSRSNKFLLCGALLSCIAAPAHAQFKFQQTFEDATATGWTLANFALLTAPSIDPVGAGWLRLTGAAQTESGQALNTATSFAGNQPVVVEFSYESWGGTGADGITMFLYDATTATPMNHALTGGGLGYCGGDGGYLAVGLDEYGNFSNPLDKCAAAGGGPGAKPESFVIRGPIGANNAWVDTTAVPGGIDNPHVATRPSPKTVLLSLTPAVSPAIGYTISAQFRSATGQPFQKLFVNVPFTYSAPANVNVGFSGGTGGSTNNHEIQGLVVASPDDLQVTMTGPSTVVQGSAATYNVTVTNDGNYPIIAGDSPIVTDTLPAALTGATWTCVGTGGATCDATGSGNINTSNATLPTNASVTYTVTATVDPSTTCGSTVGNTANADFTSTSRFLDPDETNNSASVNSTVTCNSTLVVNPGSLPFQPQTLNTPSTSQTVTVTEGSNSAAIDGITATGDYSQTNNCPATLTANQTCTISVVFNPTTEGSRSGTLTVLSNAASSPTLTSQVTLSGTGTNAVPNAFSFTPLYNVIPSSVQVSNIITVTNTNVPSPISVSSGAQYSINGGAFTSVAGVVSPGASVQVQLTAAAGYSATDSAALTIAGVSSTFTVTTGAQPVLQGGFTPVTGVAPSSVQTSNAITVSGITAPAPISIASGAEYSINGGAFTSAPGVVQPGDKLTVQLTAASTYNTTASTSLNVNGVTSTFTVTTSTPPLVQGGFTPVIGVAPLSVEISNPVTVTGFTAPVPISIAAGAEYSINGGAFTSSPGTVHPGDQLRVQLTAAAAYGTASAAVLDIGGVDAPFSVTTGAMPVLGTFTPITGAAISSATTSNAITVTGITAPAQISVSSGATYSINGGPFTAASGIIQSGDQVKVQLTTPTTYSTTVAAVIDVNGVDTQFSVTTGLQPLKNVLVTGGGGAMGASMLLLLALVSLIRIPGVRRATMALPMLAVVFGAIFSLPARAADEGWTSNFYGGVRLGGSTTSMTAAKLTHDLEADGFQVTSANTERGAFGGTVYIGYELPKSCAVELAGTYVGRTRAFLQGVLPGQQQQALDDTAHIVRGAGDIVSLEGRYRWSLAPQVALDVRAGPYLWITRTNLYVEGPKVLSRTDEGPGFTAGIGPRFGLGQHVGIGAAIDFFASTSENHFFQFSATAEYHF